MTASPITEIKTVVVERAMTPQEGEKVISFSWWGRLHRAWLRDGSDETPDRES